VVVAGRDEGKGASAVARIRDRYSKALIRYERLNLADLHSVAAFVSRFGVSGDGLYLLINNAGIIPPPKRGLTSDGFE